MNRFDPDPDAPYAKCQDCSTELQTRNEAREHMRTTREQSAQDHRNLYEHVAAGTVSVSHALTITNPTRTERIDDHVRYLLHDAYDDIIAELQEDSDLTEDEISTAVSRHDELQAAWRVRDITSTWKGPFGNIAYGVDLPI